MQGAEARRLRGPDDKAKNRTECIGFRVVLCNNVLKL